MADAQNRMRSIYRNLKCIYKRKHAGIA